VSSQATQVFVYYRVQAADVEAVIAAVAALQARLRTQMPGLTCGLSRRAEHHAEQATLMETYAHAYGVGPDRQRAIEHLAGEALGAWIVGERHVEVFVRCV
jgi:uncharacterized protein with von Willebrand factor type A (vWA) domain